MATLGLCWRRARNLRNAIHGIRVEIWLSSRWGCRCLEMKTEAFSEMIFGERSNIGLVLRVSENLDGLRGRARGHIHLSCKVGRGDLLLHGGIRFSIHRNCCFAFARRHLGCRVSAGLIGAITHICQWPDGGRGSRCRGRSDRRQPNQSWTLKLVMMLWGIFICSRSWEVAWHLNRISSITQGQCFREGNSWRRSGICDGWRNRIVILVHRAVVAHWSAGRLARATMTLQCSRTDGSRFNSLCFLLSWIASNNIGSWRTRRTSRLLWGGAEDMDATLCGSGPYNAHKLHPSWESAGQMTLQYPCTGQPQF